MEKAKPVASTSAMQRALTTRRWMTASAVSHAKDPGASVGWTALALSVLGCGGAFWFSYDQEVKRRRAYLEKGVHYPSDLPLAELASSRWRIVGGVESWPAKDSVRSHQVISFGNVNKTAGSLTGSVAFQIAGLLHLVAVAILSGKDMREHELAATVQLNQLPLSLNVPLWGLGEVRGGDGGSMHTVALGDGKALSRAWVLCRCDSDDRCIATNSDDVSKLRLELQRRGYGTERMWVDFSPLNE